MTKLTYICNSFKHQSHKKYESYVINAIWQRLGNDNIEFVTQQAIQTHHNGIKKTRLIDLYFPQIQLSVEVDEKQHGKTIEDDAQRIDDINKALSKYSIIDTDIIHIDEERILIFKNNYTIEKTLEELNKDIDNVVKKIKEKYSKCSNKEWNLDLKHKLKAIKEKGIIKLSERFVGTTNADIINLVYNKSLHGWQGAAYKKDWKEMIWFPKFTAVGKFNDEGFSNYFKNNDINYFYESRNEEGHEDSKTEKLVRFHIDNNFKRLAFLKHKHPIYGRCHTFIGVYQSDHFERDENGIGVEVWKLVSKQINIPYPESEKIKLK